MMLHLIYLFYINMFIECLNLLYYTFIYNQDLSKQSSTFLLISACSVNNVALPFSEKTFLWFLLKKPCRPFKIKKKHVLY